LQSQLIGRIARAGGDWRSASLPLGPAHPSGRFNSYGRGAKLSRIGASSSGWSVDRISGMRVRACRVVVKARVVKLSGAKVAGAAQAHLRYLQRDGVTREGEQGRFYSTFNDDVDGKAFLERGARDRHQFRFIVSPSAEMRSNPTVAGDMPRLPLRRSPQHLHDADQLRFQSRALAPDRRSS
jgi:hypothetical protein